MPAKGSFRRRQRRVQEPARENDRCAQTIEHTVAIGDHVVANGGRGSLVDEGTTGGRGGAEDGDGMKRAGGRLVGRQGAVLEWGEI